MYSNQNDHFYMAEALRQAKKGEYSVRVNPRVGCVIVKDGKIIGCGYHAHQGHPHAEINALNSIKNNDTADATAYITLEPCLHYGRTPPCVDALIKAELNRVVVAMTDPNPLVNGKGLEKLNKQGIKISSNILENEARELNKGFIKRLTRKLPYITTKSAISLDGVIALANGESKWITSEQARYDAHKLRARSCAILTGVGTVIADDPKLTVRLSEDGNDYLNPTRVILDTNFSIPLGANVLKEPGRTLIYTCSENVEKQNALHSKNVEIVNINKCGRHVDILAVMQDLAEREINEVLVESGPTLMGVLIENSMIDEMIIYMAPHLLGAGNIGIANLTKLKNIKDRIQLNIIETSIIGEDLKIKANPIYK